MLCMALCGEGTGVYLLWLFCKCCDCVLGPDWLTWDPQWCSGTGMAQLPDGQDFGPSVCSGTIFGGEQTLISDSCVGVA